MGMGVDSQIDVMIVRFVDYFGCDDVIVFTTANLFSSKQWNYVIVIEASTKIPYSDKLPALILLLSDDLSGGTSACC